MRFTFFQEPNGKKGARRFEPLISDVYKEEQVSAIPFKPLCF
jgi:hypothetical protein